MLCSHAGLALLQYITVMLANNKTSEQITEELVDLIGDNYGECSELAAHPTLPSFELN